MQHITNKINSKIFLYVCWEILFMALFKNGMKKHNAKYEDTYHHCFPNIGITATTKFLMLLLSGKKAKNIEVNNNE